ncbi:hypothetical protein SPBR_07899 [Sporothrix brasiliensis 5110]|uniref:Uncharacterized protein n=1 Tax=Sporothrix brasiliensis 5110 TaxID=1398154 RepID=A0A0C2IGR3_9PEZI|nr:uncharacterized protein SPBR_07899 [Sporothrix brasiliensis 5110]KIH88401.1 hypothetical protein SPBR_07899 [Sporothrix brasiliensis 5110]
MDSHGSIAAIDMAANQPSRRQVDVDVHPTDINTAESNIRDPQQDQRQHIAGGQPLPPDSVQMAPADEGAGASTTRSARTSSLSNLSDYARFMLLHTKQQMDATPGSPPPAHLHVAGPAGDGPRYRSGSLTMSERSQGHDRASSTHNTSSYSRGASQSTSPGRSQHHHNNSPHHHAHRTALANSTALPNGV